MVCFNDPPIHAYPLEKTPHEKKGVAAEAHLAAHLVGEAVAARRASAALGKRQAGVKPTRLDLANRLHEDIFAVLEVLSAITTTACEQTFRCVAVLSIGVDIDAGSLRAAVFVDGAVAAADSSILTVVRERDASAKGIEKVTAAIGRVVAKQARRATLGRPTGAAQAHPLFPAASDRCDERNKQNKDTHEENNTTERHGRVGVGCRRRPNPAGIPGRWTRYT